MERKLPKNIVRENEAVFANMIRKEIGTNTHMRDKARRLVKQFVDTYESTFDDILPLNRARAVTYFKRALVWCGEDEGQVSEIINFLFDNWGRIKSELDLNGRPTASLIGSANLFHRIRSLKADGFKGAIKTRFVEDESPVEGW